MMQDNFKTHTELGISEEARDGLIQTLALFESGKVLHYKELSGGTNVVFDPFILYAKSPPVAFDLEHVKVERECGTVACILGWARHLTNKPDLLSEKRPIELDVLFQMGFDPTDKIPSPSRAARMLGQVLGVEDVTVGMAAVAIRTYLETGTPDWLKAVKEPHYA